MYYKIRKDTLRALGAKIFEYCGLPTEYAVLVSDILSTNDQRGVYSHGTTFYHGYARMLLNGGANPAAHFCYTSGSCIKKADGDYGLGVINCHKAMSLAIEEAREHGLGIVTVKRSTHAAAMGYYAMMAAEKNMFGIAMSNGDPVMSTPGTKGRVMGNNPFAYATPRKGGAILFDVAMSVVAGGKIKNYIDKNARIPEGWLVDKDGIPTNDPTEFTKGGSLLPFAMHKGYGLAVMVEILSAVLSGSGIIKDNTDWFADPSAKNDIGHFMLALDISRFSCMDEYLTRIAKMERDIKTSAYANTSEVFLPGEPEIKKAERQNEWISLNKAIYENINKAHELCGLHIPECSFEFVDNNTDWVS